MDLQQALELIAELRQDKAEQRALNAELRRDKAEQREQIARLQRLVEGLSQQLEEITEILRERAPDEVEPRQKKIQALHDEASACPPKTAPLPPEPPPSPKTEKRRSRHGRRPLPADLPRDEVHLAPEDCAACGSQSLRGVDEVVSESYDYVRAHLRVRRVVRQTRQCNDCLTRTTPPAPPMPFDRAACTGALLAWLIYAKFGMHQPIERIRRELNAQGGELASGTVTGWMERAAELLAPIVAALKVELLSSPVLQTDGTGLRVLEPGVKQRPANSGQVAIYCTERIALYGYSESKAGEHAEAFLTSAKGVLYKGTIVADAASTFDRLFVSSDRIEAGCNAHGRRKFREAESFEPTLAREGIRWIQALYRAEAAGAALGLDSAGLLSYRQREMGPIVAGFRGWLEHHLPKLLPKNPLRKVLQYYVNHWDALTRFLSDPLVPLDNNLSERLLRAVAIGRKNWLFAGSEAGARRACIFLSCVETCRLNGVDPYDWLCDVLDRVVPHPRNRGVLVVDLLPWAWKEAREQAAGGGPSG